MNPDSNPVKSCCPFCNQHVVHPVELAGQIVKCPTCGHEVKLGAIRAPVFEHAPSHGPIPPPGVVANQAKNWLNRPLFGS